MPIKIPEINSAWLIMMICRATLNLSDEFQYMLILDSVLSSKKKYNSHIKNNKY